MDMSDMSMTFSASTSTVLWSSTWAPTSLGSYAGTCIFLIILAASFRVLLAAKNVLEQRWLAQARNRRYVVVAGQNTEAEKIDEDAEAQTGLLTSRGIEERVRVVRRAHASVQPWRFGTDVPRAAIVMVISGIGYLLMTAVMTMNVGYFMSVLAGTFVGELAAGRFTQHEEH